MEREIKSREREKEEEKREGGSGRIRKERFSEKGRRLGKKENLSEASERERKLF